MKIKLGVAFRSEPKQMGAVTIAALLLLLAAGCGRPAPASSDQEASLLDELGFDRGTLSEARALGESFERLIGIDEEFESVPADGVVLVTRAGEGRSVLADVRRSLEGSAYSAYLNDDAFGYGPDRIAIIRSNDEYDYLAIVRTDGVNYDVDHPGVLDRYREWDGRYDLSLTGAGQDWLEAQLLRPKVDWQAYAREVYAFCPDVVDQGTGDVESLAEEMSRTGTLYLWWD